MVGSHREQLTGQGNSVLRNGSYGCGQSSQSPTGGRVVGSHGSCMSQHLNLSIYWICMYGS